MGSSDMKPMSLEGASSHKSSSMFVRHVQPRHEAAESKTDGPSTGFHRADVIFKPHVNVQFRPASRGLEFVVEALLYAGAKYPKRGYERRQSY